MKIERILRIIADKRGADAEHHVFWAVKQGINAEFCPTWVRGVRKSRGKEEGKGIDYWVETDVGGIPLQVKSSVRGMEKALELHPEIPVVISQIGESHEELVGKIIEAISPKREMYLKQRGIDEGW